MTSGPFPISADFVHLDNRGGATLLPGFEWTREYLDAYEQRIAADNGTGRLVSLAPASESWEIWERHPAGDELVITIDGRFELTQETPEGDVKSTIVGGTAVINPAGMWHTIDVIEPGRFLFVTPGVGTEHRPRA